MNVHLIKQVLGKFKSVTKLGHLKKTFELFKNK